ncbi:phospholipase D family protein [Klebsiella indica]|uniref:phospholipase D n=1 Tax=Klebsiella indica TaxID=2582917 RepID=A0A5R9LGH4_9ENTR|nr:phospholipase D family protein [Klebsiella indica]TLV15631.1 phospholipase D family protein [Klebsiella indica]
MRKLIFALTFAMVMPVMAGQPPEIVVGFSPSTSHDAQNNVLSIINSARHSLDVAAYLFTSKPIAIALLNARQRGVSVRVVADKKANSDRYTAATFLANHHIPVRLDGHYATMHNKFIVADRRSVETGSFNYTISADKHNAENALLIRNAPELAAKYQQEFNRLWNESRPLNHHD